MVGVPADDDDEPSDDEAEPQEFSLTRDRVARVLAMLDAKRANGGLDPDETKAHEVATLRLYGAGASPKKFARLDAQQVDGVLRGQYRFAGAGQTGRMTSRGGADSEPHSRCPRQGWCRGSPAGRCDRRRLQLRRARRGGAGRRAGGAQAGVDRPSRARGGPRQRSSSGRHYTRSKRASSPWLACRLTPSGCSTFPRQRSRPDAAGHLHDRCCRHPAQERPERDHKPERQIGKVATLASASAARSARSEHGAELPHPLETAEARRIVDAWREANPWAREFWNALWDAAMDAWDMPGQITTAGRLASSIATTISAARFSWRCRPAAC